MDREFSHLQALKGNGQLCRRAWVLQVVVLQLFVRQERGAGVRSWVGRAAVSPELHSGGVVWCRPTQLRAKLA